MTVSRRIFWPTLTAAIALVIGLTPPVLAVTKDTRTISVHGTNVIFPVPEGHCALTKRHSADKKAIELIERVNQGRNTVLMMFAECKQLEAYRSDAGDLSNYGSYLAPRSARKPVRMPRPRFVEIIGAQFEKQKAAIAQAQEEAKRRVKATGLNTEIQKNTNLGLIHRDDNAAYTGLVQTWHTKGAADTRIAAVTALTLVRERVISINLTAPHAGKATVKALLHDQRALVGRLVFRPKQMIPIARV
jgi:hypothetical protein